MRFRAWNAAGELLCSREMYSVGGGFVVDADEHFIGSSRGTEQDVPYPFATMDELLALAERHNCPLTDLLWANECALHGEAANRAFIARTQAVMMACIDRGLSTPGTLPGGLRVPRRAPGMAERLRHTPAHASEGAMNWVSAWAMAVNEENAAGGRVVTAPTNGAAGIKIGRAHV